MHNAYSAAWARVTSTCPCNSELDTSEIRVILMQHAEVAPLSKRGGRHKPIRVSLWPLHPWPIWSWWWTNFHIAPRCDLESWVSYYWHLGFPDTKIADHALDHFDRNLYGLRYFCQAYIQKLKKNWFWFNLNHCSQKSVQRIKKDLGLKGIIQQAATFETIEEIYKVLRARFPTMGARRIVTVIRQEYSLRVSE